MSDEFDGVVERALSQATLHDARVFIAAWEAQRQFELRVLNPADDYESCFGVLFQRLEEKWQEAHPGEPSAAYQLGQREALQRGVLADFENHPRVRALRKALDDLMMGHLSERDRVVSNLADYRDRWFRLCEILSVSTAADEEVALHDVKELIYRKAELIDAERKASKEAGDLRLANQAFRAELEAQRSALGGVADLAVERLLGVFTIYLGYKVNSRGPYGLILEAIQFLRPEVARAMREEDDFGALRGIYERFYGKDEEQSPDTDLHASPAPLTEPPAATQTDASRIVGMAPERIEEHVLRTTEGLKGMRELVDGQSKLMDLSDIRGRVADIGILVRALIESYKVRAPGAASTTGRDIRRDHRLLHFELTRVRVWAAMLASDLARIDD